MSNATTVPGGKAPDFHTHALPKDTFDYLCSIFPAGWILLYTYPLKLTTENGDNTPNEGMVISTAIKPDSCLVPVAKHLHSITST